MMQFGFVGLGQMGEPMALNLMRDFNALVTALDTEAIARLANQGAEVAQRSEDFGCVDVLFLCLPQEQVVKDVLFQPTTGIAQHLKPGAIVVDTSTISYQATLEIKTKLDSLNLQFLDAPISGMQKRAEDATLTMMIGGADDTLATVRPALETMASNILHMGGAGAGQLTKLINNLLFDINAAALAEILPMATKLGLDPEQMAKVVNSGTGRSYASEFFAPNILKADFSQGYPMQAAYKDLVNGAEISAKHAIPTPVLAAATATYQQALLEGHGAKDKGAMILVYERLLGTAFRAQNGENT